MSTERNIKENAPDHSEVHYEELASQEEIYFEWREERARATLISEEPSPSRSSSQSDPLLAEQLEHAAEELITGDSGDPPLSEETVAEMLRTTPMVRVSDP